MVKKFRASLDRSGVHEDIRHMGQQLESTWNEMRRGLEKSWVAVRQSAESSIIPQFGSDVGVPAAPTKAAQDDPHQPSVFRIEPSLASQVKNFTLALDRMKAALFQPTAVMAPDSGKFDQWVEQANRMLADAIAETTQNPLPAQENDVKKIEKKSPAMAKKSGQKASHSDTIAYFTTKPRKSKAVISEKKKPAL